MRRNACYVCCRYSAKGRGVASQWETEVKAPEKELVSAQVPETGAPADSAAPFVWRDGNLHLNCGNGEWVMLPAMMGADEHPGLDSRSCLLAHESSVLFFFNVAGNLERVFFSHFHELHWSFVQFSWCINFPLVKSLSAAFLVKVCCITTVFVHLPATAKELHFDAHRGVRLNFSDTHNSYCALV